MPEHSGIRIRLVSQYDAMFIPEYHPPGDDKSKTATHGVDTYVPNYAASQFWIRYACDATMQEPETRVFYFKLYVAGRFAVAWGCGAQDGWRGETFFVPSDAGSGDDSNATREKFGLFFPRNVDAAPDVATLEIRVHRAKARKRQERQYASTAVNQGNEGGVQLDPIGIVKSREPRRFYCYALSDPKDMPYACFRYHFRAHDELQNWGFVKRGVGSVRPVQRSGEASSRRVGYALDYPPVDFAGELEEVVEEVVENPSDLPTTIRTPTELSGQERSWME